MGANGSVGVGKEALSGSGSLQFSYSLDNKALSSLIFPAGVGNLTGMRRIRFWLKTDHDTPIAVVLAERSPAVATTRRCYGLRRTFGCAPIWHSRIL